MNSQVLLPMLFALFIVRSAAHQQSQNVIRHPDSSVPLADRWKWAHEQAESKKFTSGYWIGYSIQRQMQDNSFIGAYSSDERRNRPSLDEVINGHEMMDILSLKPSTGNVNVMNGIIYSDDDKRRHQKVMKEVGILFHFPRVRSEENDQITVSNLSLHVNLESDPLIWLGGADDGESIILLQSHFTSVSSDECKQKQICAIGLHQTTQKVFPVLRDVLTGSETVDVREETAFWLGQMNTDEALKLLVHTVENDRSEGIREQAIFAISQMDGERSLDALIAIARKNPDNDVRGKAMFWLGQKASEKVVATLRDIVYSEEETEVQKSALFALTELPDHSGTDELIKLAKTHPNPKVRKEAIFWLGQCDDDPRALETLVEIVKKQ